MAAMRTTLSAIWIFATLNYLYCDVLGLMDHNLLEQYLAGRVDDIDMTPGFLLAAGVLMEIPIGMTLVSRLVNNHALNRWANIAAGSVMTLVQVMTLTFGSNTAYYWFFSIIEIAATATIVWLAWRWHPDVEASPSPGGYEAAGALSSSR
ncbi:MAG: hypothetical protein H6674_06110 [Dehalococcoidia bacterium]|nr:hypothetical protein [Dehalococcoidia bacterium]